jgi:hypothetical protein
MSDTSADTATAETTTDTSDTGADLAAEVEKWKAQARKHEDRAKANANAARELEQLRQQSMSDTEKAAAQAKAEGRAEALREVAAERVADAVRVAAAGRNVDVDALLEGLDRTRFAGDDGIPDRDAIQAWIDRIAPKPDDTTTDTVLVADLGQGVRGNSSMALNGDPLLRDLKSKLGIR